MAKNKKPYPGMGPFVLVLKYGETWVATVGAKTEQTARTKARDYRHYVMGETMKVVPNNPGDSPA